MELFNELSPARSRAVEDFLTFIPIYESKRRARSLNALLKRHKRLIKGKTCLEAGAGKGIFSVAMAELGAEKVYAVERSTVLYKLLQKHTSEHPTIHCVRDAIETFEPEDPIDLLYHEFYGPLVLDECILALEDLAFKPGTIMPDGGRLWCRPIMEAELLEQDELYDPVWKEMLKGALVSDAFLGVKFEPEWLVFDWQIGSGQTSFDFTLPGPADFLAFCGEITHQGKSVLKMWYTHNWPIVFTPVYGKTFRLSFHSKPEAYTEVLFYWQDQD